MAKLIKCKSCGKELSSEAKTCPHCGAAGPAPGCLAKIVSGIFLIICLGVLFSVFGDDDEGSGKGSGRVQAIEMLTNATVSNLKSTGELAAMFNLGSDYTDLQRDAKLKEIKGQVVQWTLPVYEISESGSGYMIQTGDDSFEGGGPVGCVVELTPRDDADRKVIMGLKTNDSFTFRGVLTGDTTMRSLEIEPAILWKK